MSEHHWEYCEHCQAQVVICGTCGNNCCNGGYGEVFSATPGVLVKCDDCPSAYALQDQGQREAHGE